MKIFRLIVAASAAFCAFEACTFGVSDNDKSQAQILAYTRKAVPNVYPGGIARSVHFAYSRDGKTFQPLNSNYGILFAEATLSEQSTIRPKTIKNPCVFTMKDGSFGIMAVRINENGSADDESKGKVIFWSTKDFSDFSKGSLLDVKGPANTGVDAVQCAYSAADKLYSIHWRAEDGKFYRTDTADLLKADAFKAAVSADAFTAPQNIEGLPSDVDAVSSPISISGSLCDAIALRWTKIENVAVNVPASINAKSADDVNKVKAVAVYSDKSTTTKPVAWDLSSVNFNKSGKYEITGTVQNEEYKFPLDKDFGDPVFFHWNDLWYFIGTTDARGNIGFYVRKGKTIADIFKPGNKEYLILDKDERRLLLQTFWAPEFHVIGGKLYILFAVSGRSWGPQCHMMLFKDGGDITDPNSWEDPKRVVRKDGSPLAPDGISLDMTYFKGGSKHYLAWSYRRGIGSPRDTGSMVYIATIDEKEPWKLTSDPVLLTRPLYGWENVDGTINNEGPYAFVRNGKVYLTYSGGSANAYTYAVGLLTGNENDDLLDLANWKKSGTPVLSYYSIEGEYGPGHNSFYVNANGDLMIAYHGEVSLRSRQRCDGIHRIHFNIKGEPVFDMSAERDLAPQLRTVKTTVIVP